VPAESPPRAGRSAGDLAELRDAYLAALLAPDARRARALVEEAHEDGVPAERLYLEVLQPALHEVGRLWETAGISVADEHLATQITQTVVARLADRLTRGGGGAGRRAIVSCSPGELHALGSRMVADFLEADGWDVLALGADTPADELAGIAARRHADLVALSTAMPEHLLAAGAACAALRRLEDPPFVVAGGQAFEHDAQRAVAVGADAYAGDPVALLRLARGCPRRGSAAAGRAPDAGEAHGDRVG
jgi:methanogenic corrinoid protein MtbC1